MTSPPLSSPPLSSLLSAVCWPRSSASLQEKRTENGELPNWLIREPLKVEYYFRETDGEHKPPQSYLYFPLCLVGGWRWEHYEQYFTERSSFETQFVVNNAPSQIHDRKYEPLSYENIIQGVSFFICWLVIFFEKWKPVSCSLSYTHSKEAGVIYDWNQCAAYLLFMVSGV